MTALLIVSVCLGVLLYCALSVLSALKELAEFISFILSLSNLLFLLKHFYPLIIVFLNSFYILSLFISPAFYLCCRDEFQQGLYYSLIIKQSAC